MNRIVATGLLLVVCACSESFAPPSLVADMRVVGAHVEVPDHPGRAHPRPEEQVEVSLLVIDRGAAPSDTPETPSLTPPPLQWTFVPCLPLGVTIGPPICAEAIDPCDGCIASAPTLAMPSMRFRVPSEQDLEDAGASQLLLQGVVCANGAPSDDAILRFLMGESGDLAPCDGPPTIAGRPIEGRFVTVQIPIDADSADPNLNPVLQNVLLDGTPWPPPYDQGVPRSAPRTGCATDLEALSEEERGLQPKAGDDPSTIELSVTPDSLQTFTLDDVSVTEEIQVSWLADGGAFEASFSFITDPASPVLIQWQPPGSAPEDGRLVRLTFVIRDGRGGSDSVERGLCVLPP